MEKIKILHISETFAAGVYTYIKDICDFFDNDPDFENYVIYSGEREDTDKRKFSADFSQKTTLLEVKMEREISPLKDLAAIFSISRSIKKIKPDIIHLHSSKAGVLGRIASIIYPHARVYYTPNGYSFVRQDVSNFKRLLYKFIELNINRFFGGITIACGDTEFEYAKKLGPAVLVRNGINIKNVRKFIRKKESDQFIIGTVGRMSPQKNPELFNEIALKFPNIKFVWVGDGELRNTIKASNVLIKGWIPREKVLDLINDFDIYIQTSLWEGLPFTIIEAMALKKPIIATNVIGNKDAIKHDYNGYVCDNLIDFEKYISKIIQDNELGIEMGENSQIRADKLFDRDKNFKQLDLIYRNI